MRLLQRLPRGPRTGQRPPTVLKLTRLTSSVRQLKAGPRMVPTPSEQRLRGNAGKARRWRLWQGDPYCAACKRLLDWPAGFEADHVVPLSLGGEDRDENMQLLCVWFETDGTKRGCHAEKTATERQGNKTPT